MMKKVMLIVFVSLLILNSAIVLVPNRVNASAPGQSQQRTVLAELFTGTWCPYCQGAEGALDRLADEYPRTQLAIIEWHNEDDYESGASNERAEFYSVLRDNYPTAYFDGVERIVGGSENPDDNTTYNKYREQIENRLKVPSPLEIRTKGHLTGGEAKINAEITAVSDVSASNLYVHFVLYNDHNETVYAGGREYRLRYTALDSKEFPITIKKGETIVQNASFSVDWDWEKREKLGVVTFVQTHNKDFHAYPLPVYYTAEILQSDDLRFYSNLGVETLAESNYKEVAVDNSTEFCVNIYNRGFREDYYEIEADSGLSFEYRICNPETGTCNPEKNPTPILIGVGERREAHITVDTTNAEVNQTYTLTFTVYSETNAETCDSVTLTLKALSTPPLDSDNDGFSDAEEIAADTDPNDPNDYPGAGGEKTKEEKKGFIPGFDAVSVLIGFAVILLFARKKRFL